jgi:hypothetical protein
MWRNIPTACSNSAKVRAMGVSGSGSESTGQPSTPAIRFRAVNPIRRHNRAWDEAVLGARDKCIAAPSKTARSPISHENQGSGDRKSSITGYVVWLSTKSAAHPSHEA